MLNYQKCTLSLEVSYSGSLQPSCQDLIMNANRPLTEKEIQSLFTSMDEESEEEKKIAMKIPKLNRVLQTNFLSPHLKQEFQSVIKQVPGRREQAQRIFQFMSESENGASSPLCIYGNTGCGKTSLIMKVLDFFKEKFSKVNVVYLNCMHHWTSKDVQKVILSKLFNCKSKDPKRALFAKFTDEVGPKQKVKIIVLDQIDQFIKSPSFLYNILEWLNLKAKIIIVFISNVIDMEAKLQSKLQSRMKFSSIIFRPYSYRQIEEIIYHKYKKIGKYLKKDSVVFLSKRIANINSDIRSLQKVYSKIVYAFLENNLDQPMSIDLLKPLIQQDFVDPFFDENHKTVMKILLKASSKEDVTEQIHQKLYITASRTASTNQVMLILTDLQQSGMISYNTRTFNVRYKDIGIVVHQIFHLLYDSILIE